MAIIKDDLWKLPRGHFHTGDWTPGKMKLIPKWYEFSKWMSYDLRIAINAGLWALIIMWVIYLTLKLF